MATETLVHTWPWSTDTDPRLFMDLQGGEILCRRHLGGYGTTELNGHPHGIHLADRVVWITPLAMWTEMTAKDRADHATAMAEFFQERGDRESDPSARCESCGYNPDDLEQRAAREHYEAEVKE